MTLIESAAEVGKKCLGTLTPISLLQPSETLCSLSFWHLMVFPCDFKTSVASPPFY